MKLLLATYPARDLPSIPSVLVNFSSEVEMLGKDLVQATLP